LKTKTIAVAFLALALIGCDSGTGIDTKLSSKDEFSYRVSIDKAWMEMSEEQKEAYNWAVNKYSLTQLLAKYPGITPRKVIKGEVDSLLVPQEKKLAELQAYLAANAEQLAHAEAVMRDVKNELEKITIKPIKAKEGEFVNNFIYKNSSRFNLSFSEWIVTFGVENPLSAEAIEYEECKRFTFPYPVKSGATVTAKKEISAGGDWECLGMLLGIRLSGKQVDVKAVLNEASVKDHTGQYILPRVPTQSDYENNIARTLREIEFLKAKKSVLN